LYKDFLVSGKTGFLVEFGNKADFRNRIVELIKNQDLKATMSEYNRRLIKQYYISTCAERYISVFKEVIGELSRTRENLN
jgi:glycosyltransferase involved in cell wall biosynthesis